MPTVVSNGPSGNQIAYYSAADDPIELAQGRPSDAPVTLQVQAGTGSVTIELWDLVNQNWYLPAGATYTVTGDKEVEIARGNKPPVRITFVGDARAAFFGDIRT